jgi:hypothetical protein
MDDNKKIQWQPLVELGIVLITILGSTIPLFLHMDSKIDRFQEKNQENIELMRKETNEILKSIAQEIKDFHGRLCAIEEKNKGK